MQLLPNPTDTYMGVMQAFCGKKRLESIPKVLARPFRVDPMTR